MDALGVKRAAATGAGDEAAPRAEGLPSAVPGGSALGGDEPEEGEIADAGVVAAGALAGSGEKAPKERKRKKEKRRSRSRSKSRRSSSSRSRSRGRRDRERDRDRERERERQAARQREAAEREAASRFREQQERDAARRRDEARDRERRDGRRRSRSRSGERRRRSRSRSRDRDRRRDDTRARPREPEPEPELDEAEQARLLAAFEAAQGGEEADEDVEREARRRRRQAILAKHGVDGAAAPAAPPAVVAVPAVVAEAEAMDAYDDPVFDPDAAVELAKPAEAAAAERAVADMFDDDDAAFQAAAEGGVEGLAPAQKAANAAAMAGGLVDAWDDVEGYYQARVGEVLDGRYEVFATHGRGVFSTVLRARDTAAGPGEPAEVAVKVIRANETMTKAAQQEVVILRKLAGADADNRRHCVRLLRTFEYRQHSFLVFESLAMNLREVLKKYGRNVGLSISAVQAYAQQMLIALKHLRNCGVLHADIKPDNILVTERYNMMKVADFGSAMFDGDNEITPYLVSRFYRAPEIILGLKYSHPLDMWSVGCVLYELYMGAMAFPGRSNNEMLKLFMEVKGPFPRKMVRRALFRERHFDAELTFGVMEPDAVTQRDVRRLIRDTKPTRDLAAVLAGASKSLSDAERRKVANLADLLDKMFALDPTHRITVAQALVHPFIKEVQPGPGMARP